MMNKKAAVNMNRTIEGLLIVVLIIIILFSVYSALIPEAQKAGDKFNASNRCAAAGCFYNETDNAQTTANCRENSTNVSFSCPSSLGDATPLAGLFGSKGIVFLLIMVGLLLIVIKQVLPKGKK